MKRFRIIYRESADSETQETTSRGYDSEHAGDRFLDQMNDEGGTQGLCVVSVTEIRQHPTTSRY